MICNKCNFRPVCRHQDKLRENLEKILPVDRYEASSGEGSHWDIFEEAIYKICRFYLNSLKPSQSKSEALIPK